MTVEPYHRFVFDADRRRVVGLFEEMYRAEDAEGFDSWHQDDLSGPRHRIALALLAGVYDSLLDVGCGKGAMTGLLASLAARTVGVDVSLAAVEKAKARFPGIDFRVAGRSLERELAGEHFSLVTCMEVLSYIEDWRGELKVLASLGDRLFICLYLPPDPIGYVKSLDDLREGFSAVAEIETEVLVDRSQLLLLGTSR